MNTRWTGVARLLDHATREADTRGDVELLEAFLGQDDAEAFARLVRRHGPMVQGVCRRVLGNSHDVDDAFQATFLVLLRKAPSLQWRERLAPWLHGVAHRTALKARSRRARYQAFERPTTTMTPEPRSQEMAAPDGVDCLDEELLALPEKYRLPLVLCELQGQNRREAARMLHLPEGTLSSRLARGRQLLRRRLTRRGVTLSAAGVLTLLTAEARADVAMKLVSGTVRIAAALKAGKTVSASAAPVLSLTEGVVKSMFLNKLKTMAVLVTLLLTLGGVATSTLATAWGQDEVAKASPPIPPPLPVATVPVQPDEQFSIRIGVFVQPQGQKRKTVANPQLIVRNGQAGSFLAGGQEAVELGIGTTKTIKYVPFGTQVKITPTRIDPRSVRLEVEASLDVSEKPDGFDYHVSGRHVKFGKTVLLGETETIVLERNDEAPAFWLEIHTEAAETLVQEAKVSPIPKAHPATTLVQPVGPLPAPQQSAPAQPLATIAPSPQPAFPPQAQPLTSSVPDYRTYLIEAKLLESSAPGAAAETLSMPRIVAVAGQAATVEVSTSVGRLLSMQTTVRSIGDNNLDLRVLLSDMKRDKNIEAQVSHAGAVVEVRSRVTINQLTKVVLSTHADGSPKVWAELTTKECSQPPVQPPMSISPRPMVATPPTLPDGILPFPVVPTLPSGIAPASAPPVLRDVPVLPTATVPQRKLQLRHRSTSDGPRVELSIDNVRLEATKLTIGSGAHQHRIEAFPNGLLVEGPSLKTVCTELVLSAGMTVKDVPFTTKSGKLTAVSGGDGSPRVAHLTWGDAKIACTKLEIANELSLTVHADGLHAIRGDSVLKAERIELEFDTNQLKALGTGQILNTGLKR